MAEPDAAGFLPDARSLTALRRAAASCRGCDLYRAATQTVFGKGLARARVMLMGEQPGDKEDIAGAPFVGPAGRMLDRAFGDVGIDRAEVYLTNAVKHFKFTERGKRRIHQKPTRTEVLACRPWWVAEVHAIRPEILVCLGATAAQAVFGTRFRLTHHRGELLDAPGSLGDLRIVTTVHPSSLLRVEDRDEREEAYGRFRDDLAVTVG